MENLQRYGFYAGCNTPESVLVPDNDGNWVKFSDIAEALKPSHNTTKGEIICPVCKVPRLHIAYSELEHKYRCIYCNHTWAAN